jgi:hypothetical protein
MGLLYLLLGKSGRKDFGFKGLGREVNSDLDLTYV